MSKYGFNLKSSAFERIPENGLVQRIYLTLGGSWSIKANEIALGFEVTTQEWVTVLHPYIPGRNWKSAAASEMRFEYVDLIDKDESTVWYPLALGIKVLIARISPRIENTFVPYLDSLKSRRDIIEMWRRHGKAIGLPPRHELSMAILMYVNEWKEEGGSMLERLLMENSENAFYRSTISSLLDGGSVATLDGQS